MSHNQNTESADKNDTAPPATTTAGSKDTTEDEEEAIWQKEDVHDWDLTYNVWHMLPWMERKAMANKYGCKTIGEFEEYMTMRRAVGETTTTPYPKDHAYPPDKKPPPTAITEQDGRKPAADQVAEEEEEDEADNKANEEIESSAIQQTNPDDDLSTEELIRLGGLLLVILPEELLHTIFGCLSVDAYATLALVSPHWKHLTRTEAVYRRLCERTYLNQSKRRALHVARFGGSYRTMLYHRPRVRTGLYVMKFAKVKQIQRDMWCEIPVGAILESVYYRYIYFLENGSVLYALTTASPHDVIRRFLKVLLWGEADAAIVWGHFVVQGKSVTVTAQQEWQHVQLELSILPESHWGRFGALTFDRHLTSASGNFDEYAWPNDIHEFPVPHEVFRYLHDRRL